MTPKKLPSREYLLECFTDAWRDGVLIWADRPRSHFQSSADQNRSNARNAGKPAGYINLCGVLSVSLNGGKAAAHRIIFKLAHNLEPAQVDHIDVNRNNNRPENLRAADQCENQWNRPVLKKSKTGYKGVFKRSDSEKWFSVIRFRGDKIYLGSFLSPKDAAKAYENAAKKYHGDFARTK